MARANIPCRSQGPDKKAWAPRTQNGDARADVLENPQASESLGLSGLEGETRSSCGQRQHSFAPRPRAVLSRGRRLGGDTCPLPRQPSQPRGL